MLRRLLSLPASDGTQRAIILFSLSIILTLGLSSQYSIVRAATFTVTSAADDAPTTCDANCTLREAIIDANGIGGADLIIFNIAGGVSPQTISLGSALPDVTETVSIDGGTQTGAACNAPPITLNGGAGGNGLSIAGPAASGSSIRGFTITSFVGNGISLSGADNNTIECNNIGGLSGNSGDGINITNSSDNVIGGAGNSNQIAFNGGSGVNVTAGANINNRISQNNIFSNGGYITLGGGGANNNQAAPALILAGYDTTNLTITGSLTSTANTTFDLEYFVCDGTPEAGQFIGSGSVTTNGFGAGTINDSLPATLSSGAQIAVTATDLAGNTSQFSNCLTISELPIYDSIPVPNDPTPINIGSSLVGIGVTRSDTVTISNIGAGSLNVSFSVGGGDFLDFTVNTPASIVTPGTPLDVAVTCTPSAVGILTTTLTVIHDGTGTPISPVTYELECTGTAAPVPDYESVPVPSSVIDMGSSLLNLPTDVNVLQVSNQGGALLVLNSITVTGGDAGDFTVLTAPTTLGLPIDIFVRCTPTASGLRTTTLVIDTNDTTQPVGSPSGFSYTLECTGDPGTPEYLSNPAVGSPIDIGNTPVGTPITNANALVISNNAGTGLLNITGIGLSGGDVAEFTLNTPTLTPIAIGSSASISISCNPTTTGTRTTTLTLSHDAPTPASPITYTVNCTGNPPPAPAYGSIPAVGSPIDIGNTPVGTPITNATALTISNTGTAPLNITGIGLSGGDVAEFTLNTPTLAPIVAAGSGIISISCNPTTTGTRTTTLTLSHDAPTPASPVTYTVNCTGDPAAAPAYGSTPAVGSPIDIGNTPVGTPITNATALTISNSGTAALNITGIGLSGGDVAEFTLDTLTLAPIAAAGSGIISISCNPTTTGIRTTTLTLSHDAPTPASPITYTVNCTGDPVAGTPAYGSTPAVGNPIDIGNTPVGTPITNATALTISNSGTAALNITGIGLSGGDVAEFTLDTLTLAPIAAAGSGIISISCNPTTTGIRTTTLTLSHDAPTPASPITYTVNCTGDPVAGTPAYGSTPAVGNPIDIGNTPVGTPITHATALTISNTGTAALNITGIGLSGGDVAEYTLDTLTLAPIAAAGSGIISISCNPTTTGIRTTTLTLSHDAPTPASPITYTVNCTGNPPPAPIYDSNPAVGNPIDIGNTPVGTPITNATALTISNTGTAALNITGIGLSGGDVAEFTLNTPTLAPIVAAGSDVISISCNPTTTGIRTTTLTLSHDAPTPASPITYTVNCTGNPPPAPIYDSNPAVGNPIDIGNTPVGTPITNATALTITNTGGAPLNITGIGLSGGNVAEFTLNTPTLASIAAAGSGVISISCNPTVIGTRTTTLTLSHDAPTPASPITYTVNCIGTTSGPIYASNPAIGNPINVGTTVVGTPITNATALTISNTGNAPLNITAIAISGGQVTNFTLNTTTIAPIAAAGSANVSISCNPSAAGLRSTTLTVTHNAPGSPTTYTVNCTGTTPGVGAYASSPIGPGGTINVGTVLIDTAISFNMNTSNTGTGAITVGIPTITGDPSQVADFAVFTIIVPPATQQFPYTLNPNSSQAITIRCIPRAVGVRQATLTLPVSGASNLTSAIYLLQCTGSGTAVVTATPIGFVPTATAFVPTVTPVVPANGSVEEVKGLAMRTGPYLGATLIGKAIPGVPYPILAQSNDEGGGITWYLITVDTVTGWVSGLYLNVSGNIGIVPFQGSIFDQIDGAPDVGVTARAMSIIDIRRRPSGRAAILTQVPQDGIVRLLGRTRQNGGDFWVQVNYNGVIGWIPAAPIAVNGSTGNVPIR